MTDHVSDNLVLVEKETLGAGGDSRGVRVKLQTSVEGEESGVAAVHDTTAAEPEQGRVREEDPRGRAGERDHGRERNTAEQV